uniref:Uncharacterized protein n=1 Tax=Morchella brunnea TaxID=1174671 RepID=A0A8K1MIM1_9PEZI|nr:hypothetical protein LK370_mgp033 [Morchella brunnea]UBU98597.1 hypothetical protein [Morchella brunnea]
MQILINRVCWRRRLAPPRGVGCMGPVGPPMLPSRASHPHHSPLPWQGKGLCGGGGGCRRVSHLFPPPITTSSSYGGGGWWALSGNQRERSRARPFLLYFFLIKNEKVL